MDSQFTGEQAEFAVALAQDPKLWIESCLFIVDKDSMRSPFLMNIVQNDYLQRRSRRDIVLKSRKMGMSTLILAIFLHACVFRKNTRAVIISHDKDATSRLLERLRYMLRNSAYPINVGRETADTITFPDTDSWLYIGTAGSRAFGRGDDITHAHLSEYAYYPTLDIITSVGEALVNDAWMVLETTANGAGTPAHEIWLKAISNKSTYQGIFFPWFKDPSYAFNDALTKLNMASSGLTPEEKKIKAVFNLTDNQILWRRWKIKENHGDVKKFMQEFPATSEEAWLSSGRMVFDWDAIMVQENGLLDEKKEYLPPKWRGIMVDMGTGYKIEPIKEGPLSIWASPRDGVEYLISFDSADGVEEGDWSVADVWETKTWQQVAQYRARIAPDKFGDECFALGSFYGWASICGENNYPGNAVLMRLRDKKYPNLWRDPLAANRTQGDVGEPGFKTTEKSKGQTISDLRQALRDQDVKIMSPDTIRELRTFCVLDNGSMGAREGCHDDTVMSAAIGTYVLKRWTMDPEEKRLSARNHLSVRISPNKPAYGRSSGQSAGLQRII